MSVLRNSPPAVKPASLGYTQVGRGVRLICESDKARFGEIPKPTVKSG